MDNSNLERELEMWQEWDSIYHEMMQNVPGDTLQEKIGNVALGPLGALLTGMGTAAANRKGIEPSPVKRALRSAIQRAPSLRWMEALPRLWTHDYNFRDPAGKLKSGRCWWRPCPKCRSTGQRGTNRRTREQ